MEPPIPKDWIDAVVRIIRTGDLYREILITKSALQDWDAATMTFPYELLDCITQSLNRNGVTGNLVEGLEERGQSYEFWIFHKGKQLYAKICLLEGKLKIKIISAHTPRKGTGRL
jgi:hypothetical protein